MSARVVLGDVVSVLRDYSDNHFDGVLCDPPYGLSFMGKRWDYDVPTTELWAEVLRVCKPGAPLLAAFGSRTYHRGVVRIEDAGWEIRDSIAWMYGSGFPKSLDVSKALDKASHAIELAGPIREHLRRWVATRGLTNKDVNAAVGSSTKGGGMAGHWLGDNTQPEIPSKAQWAKLRALLAWNPCELDELYDAVKDGAERPVVGTRKVVDTSTARPGLPSLGAKVGSKTVDVTAAATPLAAEYSGYGTALKPAFEPYVLARKPLDGTVAENVARWGVGGLAIDACRIGRAEDDRASGWSKTGSKESENVAMSGKNYARDAKPDNDAGRWPANVLLDEEAGAALDGQTGVLKSGDLSGNRTRAFKSVAKGGEAGRELMHRAGDSGGASRFFYCAKASKRERGEGNKHPTVKPLALCEYLARLILPPRPGVLLVPFAGSGSEVIGALRAGWPEVVGIEREAEYVEIASRRLEAV